MEERVSERFVIDKSVRCSFESECVDAFAYNLSMDGCMIDVPDLFLRVGDALSVQLFEGVTQHGEVVWSQSGAVGIRFSHPIHVAVLQLLQLSDAKTPITDMQPVDRFGRVLPKLGALRRLSRETTIRGH